MLVVKIDEHICSNGAKVQKWQCGNGWDIVVMQTGTVQSTVFTTSITQAEDLFLQRIKDIEYIDLLLHPLNKKVLCMDEMIVEMKSIRDKCMVRTYKNNEIESTIKVEDYKDALIYYKEKIEKHKFKEII